MIIDPENLKANSLKFDPASETLLPFAKKCATHITPERKTIREDMKMHLLLHQQGIDEVSTCH